MAQTNTPYLAGRLHSIEARMLALQGSFLTLVAPFIASAIACVDLSVCSSRQSSSASQPSPAGPAPELQPGSAA